MKDIRQQWKALASDRNIKSEDIATLCLYKSLSAENKKEIAISYLSKSFQPITNQIKLNNGARPYGALDTALHLIKYSTLFSWLDAEEQKAILELSREIYARGNEIK